MTDPRAQQHAEQSLESQLDGLLADVASTVDEIGRKLGDDPIPTEPDEPTLSIGVENETIGANDVQQALEAAVEADAPPEPGSTGQSPPEPESAATAGAEPTITPATTPAAKSTATDDYGDTGSLDDELAALASHALDEDLGGPDPAETTPEPADRTPTEAPADTPGESAGEAQADERAPAAHDSGPVPQPTAPPIVEAEPADSARPSTPPAEPARRPAAASPGRLRWGWLPPKPEWEPVYGRHRPLIAAWRHAAWVVPPLLAHVGRWLLARIRATEPHARHAVAVIASPLSMRDKTVRSSVGWLAVWTLFLAVCLWVYVLVARSPATPPAPQPPTMLAGESAVANADN